MTDSRAFRAFAIVVSFVSYSPPAFGAGACEALEAAANAAPRDGSAQELRAAADKLKELIDQCSPGRGATPATLTAMFRARQTRASLEHQIAKKMKAESAAPETAPTPTKKAAGKTPPAAGKTPSAPHKPSVPGKRPSEPPNGAALKESPVAPSAPQTGPPSPPQPGPTESAMQARRAIDASKEGWEFMGKKLAEATDNEVRKILVPLHVSAAMSYLQDLILWGNPRPQEVIRVLTPLLGDKNASLEGFEIAAAGARIHDLLNDPASADALKKYIETSIARGKTVPPEQAKAMNDAFGSKFSESGLETLQTVWAQQKAEGLARQLRALAAVGERIRADKAAKKRLLLGVQSPPQNECADKFVQEFKEMLGIIYADRILVVPLEQTGKSSSDFNQQLKAQLANAARGACVECDSAVGVSVQAGPTHSLAVNGRIAFRGAEKTIEIGEPVIASCETDAPVADAAGALFTSMLEKVSVKHKSASLFSSAGVDITVQAADPIENVRFGCGAFDQRLSKPERDRTVALQAGCSAPASDALQSVFQQAGFKIESRSPKPDEPSLILKERGPEEGLPTRCEASLLLGGKERLHFWSEVLVSEPAADELLNAARNAKTGDRLGLCLVSHYYSSLRKDPLPPKEPPKPPETPRWLLPLLAPGVPILTDDNPRNDWLGYAWLGADVAALVGTVGFGAWSIERRNAAAGSSQHDLDTANALLTVSAVSGAVFATSHLVSFFAFGFRDKPGPQTGAIGLGPAFTW